MDDKQEKVQGYTIQRSILFENNRGFALGENPNAPEPFVTWMFTENENGKRDYYWGHYTKSGTAALRDYEDRAATLEKDYGLSEKGVYKYYSTQRPVDLGTFPKTENGPKRIVNFDAREQVEIGHYQAWGYLIYHAPLTEKQIADYELRAAPFGVVLTVLAAIITFLFCVGGALCYVACVGVTLLAIVAFIAGQTTGGIACLVIAFLISPFGLPAIAEWLVGKMHSLNFALRDFITG